MHIRVYIQLCDDTNDLSSMERPQYVIHARANNPSSGFFIGQTFLCSLYKFHSSRPPVFEHNHPFSLCVRALVGTQYGNIPSELEVVASPDTHIPKFTLIRTAAHSCENNSTEFKTMSSQQTPFVNDDWSLCMPNHTNVFVVPGSVLARLNKTDNQKENKETKDHVEQRIGFSWMEITNVGLQNHETCASYDTERIQSLTNQMNSSGQRQNETHYYDKPKPHDHDDTEPDVRMWQNAQDDVPIWYTVFFVLFLILSVICAVMFVLMPFTN